MATIKKSFCYLCLGDCGINVSLDKQEQIIKITSDFNDPVSHGYICEKAQKLKDHQISGDRITSPLKRINGEYVKITWQQALTEISAKFNDIISSGKADRIFYMATNASCQEITKAVNKELIAMLGSKYCTDIFSVERMHKYAIDSEFYNQHIYPDRENCQTLIVLGKNSWVTNQYARARKILSDIKNNPNRNLIVIDPCDTETSKRSDLHFKINPGTDAWFLSALITILIKHKLVDQEYIDQNLENYHIIKDHFSKINLDEYLIICGIDRSHMDQLISLISTSNGVAIDSGNGIDHGAHPYSVFYLLNVLIHITGNYQKQGGMIPIFSFLQPDSCFSKKKSPFTDQHQLKGVTSYSILSENLYVNDHDKFEAVVIESSNPANRVPNKLEFKKQLAKIDLVIVLDSFTTDTTRLADYVLPITTFFENYEVMGGDNFKNGYAQLSRPILNKPQFAKHSQDIFEEILVRLGIINPSEDQINIKKYAENPNQFLVDLYKKSTANQINNTFYILRKTLGTKYDNSMIAVIWWQVFLLYIRYFPSKDLSNLVEYTHKQIDKLVSTGMAHVTDEIDQKILYNNNKINLTPSFTRLLLKLDKSRIYHYKFPFILMTGIRQSSSVNGIIRSQESPYIEINNDDAIELGIIEGDIATVTTETGSLDLQCKITSKILPKTLRMPNSQLINDLTKDSNIDHINPQYRHVFADIKLRKNIL